MVKKFLVGIMAAVVCLVTTLTGSGIGIVYGVYEKAMTAVILLFIFLPLARTLLKGEIWPKDLLLFLGLVVVIGLWPMFQGQGTTGFVYGWLLLVPFIVGQIPFSSADVRIIGLVCGGFAFAVLASNLFFGMFGGWNPNNIAMLAFLGCTVCTAVPWRGSLEKTVLLVFLAVMAFWVLRLDSRSCVFGILLLCLLALNIVKPSFVLHHRPIRRLLLIAPALIAIVVVVFQNMELFNILNDLSQEYFGKSIFNGRNDIWEQGLKSLIDHPWLGTGAINGGHWHNVAVTALVAFGSVGYLLWIGLFDRIMEKACAFGQDAVLSGCTASFLVLMLQQSFELGMISTQGSVLSYLPLGIMLGRMRYLASRENTL